MDFFANPAKGTIAHLIETVRVTAHILQPFCCSALLVVAMPFLAWVFPSAQRICRRPDHYFNKKLVVQMPLSLRANVHLQNAAVERSYR